MEDWFRNPYFWSLKTEHSRLALGSAAGKALRFPADVIPFGGLAEESVEALAELRELMAPGESIYVTASALPSVDGLEPVLEATGLQMVFPAELELPALVKDVAVRELRAADAPRMVGLTDVAFPGYFRRRTYVLGRYFGVEIDGELIAMAGERLALPGLREISAVCTHPAHRGKGYAGALIAHLMKAQRDAGLASFLHVLATNVGAIGVYERLGFVKTRELMWRQVRRS